MSSCENGSLYFCKSLTKGATPIDFAFNIHTDLVMRNRGSTLNG
ncbi:MAG: TGS domain-containing protein, partial [Psychromonas sp.]